MALKFSALLLFVSSVIAAPLPELITKQDATNIRYLTRDGKFTYYQRRSGDLLLGTNFNVTEVLKSEMGTQYNVIGHQDGNWLVIRQVNHYHRSYDPRLNGKIYRVKRGEINTIELGEGVAPELHLNGAWVSFYEPHTRLINFKSLDNPQIGFNIQTPSKLNPFFFPSASMTDDQTALYIDMNEKGESALIRFNRIDGKTKVLFKPDGVARRLELCAGFGKVYLGAFPYQQMQGASEIWEIDKDKGPSKPLYASSVPDLGHMVCNHTEGKIFFSKGFKQGESIRHDIHALTLSNGETQAISDLRYATQVINHDGLLLIPFQGKYLVPLKQQQEAGKENLSDEAKQ